MERLVNLRIVPYPASDEAEARMQRKPGGEAEEGLYSN
jgi:hypothetical protein